MATNQEIRDAGLNFISDTYYHKNPYTLPTTEEDDLTAATGAGIPYTNAFTGGGGGGGGGAGNPDDLRRDFNQTITDREARINEANRPLRPAQFPSFPDISGAQQKYNEFQNAPYRMGANTPVGKRQLAYEKGLNEQILSHQEKARTGQFGPSYIEGEKPSFKRSVQDFIYDKVPYINRPQSKKDIMTKGYQEPEGPGMPSLIGFLNKMGIQNFSSLPQADQAFIKSQSGYRGPTVFGENTSGLNVDPFGMNVESMFGNYAEGVSKDYTKLSGMLSGKLADKYGVEWNAATGEYESDDADLAAKANKMTTMLRSRYGFRKKQIDEKKGIDIELRGQQFPKGDGVGQSGPDADWGGHGSVEAYDESMKDTYARSVDRHRGPDTPSQTQGQKDTARAQRDDPGLGGHKKGGRVRFFYGGLARLL